MEEAQARGYEVVVFFNEVIRQNPSNTIYTMPGALGDEHQTLVLDANGDTTLVMPHWGAERVRSSGAFSEVIAVKQEKGPHSTGTLEVLINYPTAPLCFDMSTVSAQMWFRILAPARIGNA